MKNYMFITLLCIFIFTLLVACGSGGDSEMGAKHVELPDDIPADFPFPDSLDSLKVLKTVEILSYIQGVL